jgi:hypothetical protein
MSENLETQRNAKGQFLVGHDGYGGRKLGSRNKLATEFIDALYADFQKNGIRAISKVAKEQPHQYLKIIAAILPKELEIAVHLNSNLFQEAQDFFQAYKLARDYIGAEPIPELIEARNEA